jgi:predicted small lipoprotein YifL
MRTSLRLSALCAVAAVFALAGCGDKKPDAAATGDSAASASAQAAASGPKPRPGHWDVKLVMTDFDIPGMPENLKQAVGRQMNQAGDIATCLTAEEAARNDGKFFGPHNDSCKYQSFAMADGKVDAKMTCDQRGAKQTIDLNGSYGADAYDLTLNSRGEMNGQPMKMAMHVTGARTGECTGKEPH